MRFVRMTTLALALLLSQSSGLAQNVPGDDPNEGPAEEEDESLPEGDTGGAAQVQQPASLVETLFSDLNSGTVQQKVETLYSPNVVYEDPIGRYEGRDKMLDHVQGLIGSMLTVSVDVREEFVSGDETVALWTMTFANKHLRSGDPITIDGITHLRTQDGHIIMQQDYYDLGMAVYEQVPVIGMLVRWVKGKL